MLYYHETDAANLPSISKHGLLTAILQDIQPERIYVYEPATDKLTPITAGPYGE